MSNRLEFKYVSDYVVVIITADTQEEADEIFRHEMKRPERYRASDY